MLKQKISYNRLEYLRKGFVMKMTRPFAESEIYTDVDVSPYRDYAASLTNQLQHVARFIFSIRNTI